MGQAKRELERREALEQRAIEAALEAKAIRECEGHSGVYIDRYDEDARKAAYAIGTNMFKRDEIDGTREEFMDAIKAAIEGASDKCYACAKHASE